MKGALNEKTSKVADEMHIYVATEVLVIVEVYVVSELTVKKSIFRTSTIFKDFKASTIIAPIAQTVAGVLLSLLFIDLFCSSHLMVSFVLMTYVPKVSSEPKVRSVEVGAACAHQQKDATAKERLLSEANNKFASMANKVEAMR
ncbi:hypothetical protein V6N13_033997 [Hibiscus sabdariffa]|uniref:Uncharacterized protein n=1 Tax=Hibiscus sabdariffa TaxID=183260 RepID=A0ABR2F8U5_9ROSI